jgi:hypothetical protein
MLEKRLVFEAREAAACTARFNTISSADDLIKDAGAEVR